jgi:hypothetical protein
MSNIRNPVTLYTSNTIEAKEKTLQKYLLDIMDIIKIESNITEITKRVNYVTNTLSSKIEIYKLIDEIESVSLSIVTNIGNNINKGIILNRIEYVREIISKLPENTKDQYSAIGTIVLNILNMITEGIGFKEIESNLIRITSLLEGDVELMKLITIIQSTIISIIQNIGNGTSKGIIESRVEYLRTLISQLPCN